MLLLFYFCTQFTIVRFMVSGGLSALVTIGTVYILTHIYDVWYLIATTIGFLLAVTVNFTLQKLWTFRDRSLERAHTQSIGFFMVNGINFFLNTLLMVFFVEYFSFWPVLAQVCAAGLIAIESFIAYSLIFSQKTAQQSSELLPSNNNIVHPELERPRMNG